MEKAPHVGVPSPPLPGQHNKARNHPKKALQPISAVLMSLTGAIRLFHTPKRDSALPLSPICHLLSPPPFRTRCSPEARQDQVTG